MTILYVLGTVLLVILFRLLRVYACIPLYALYWKRQAKNPVPAGAFRLVVIGDSVAQGIGSSRVSQSFVRRIMRATSQKLQRPVHVTNLSVTGATINDAIDGQLPQLKTLASQPDLLLVELGANDIKTFTPETFEADYVRLLKLLPSTAILTEVPPFGGVKGASVLQANTIIRRLAADHHFTLVPLHSVLMSDISFLNNSGDFFHPGNRGHRVWFNGFWPVIKARLDSVK